MFSSLVKVAITCLVAGSAVATAVPSTQDEQPLNVPTKITYRQADKDSILRRSESRRVAARAGALQPRQSARVYPTCSSGSPGYIPQSGFVAFPEYSIGTASDNFIDGYYSNVSPLISCVMLCENTAGCTAGYYAGGTTCYLRKGTVPGTNMVPRPGTDRVAYLRGDCASLEGQINNSTIMEACCNNPAPSSIARCSYSGYQNLGNYCYQTRLIYTTANRLATTTVAGGTNNDLVLKNCAAYCTQWTADAKTSRHFGCTIASFSYNTNGGPNCAIYGGQVMTMSGSDADYTGSLIAGTCEQVAANNIPDRPSGGGCYSPQSGP